MRINAASVLLVVLISTVPVLAEKPAGDTLTQTAIFVSGEGGYHTYRIPALIVSPRGTLLAFCEGRRKGAGDAGQIDLLLRRSFNGGKTWEPVQVVWADGENTCGNPCPVVDRTTGTIWLLLTHNLGRDSEHQIIERKSKGTRTVWVSQSTDDGATWAKPVDITRDTKAEDWTWYATGPGVGIQLRNGRLLIPCDHVVAGSRTMNSHVIYSDDHGATWKRGGVAGPDCNECQVVERSDGSLLLNMRGYRRTYQRLISTSQDGGKTWSKPVEDPVLIEPVCQASLIRHPTERGTLLFSNPASKKRERMAVRLSEDEGKTWPAARLLYEGPSAYSCLAVLSDGTIGCLYERGVKRYYETITFARFPLRWLKTGQNKP